MNWNGASMRTPLMRSSAPRGMTLVEVIISMSIFVVLAGFTILAVQQTVSGWQQSERRRVLYERASGVMDIVATDLRLAVTDEQSGVTKVGARLIGDFDPTNGSQRVMFVRAFETGPERAMTFSAGDGRAGSLTFRPPDDDGSIAAPLAPDLKTTDAETYTGTKVGDFKPLGGLAAVGLFVRDETLYRAIQAPPPDSLAGMFDPNRCQIIAKDVLYLGFDYWSQDTKQWEPDRKEKVYSGPEKIWDSTRSITVPPLNKFFLHRGPDSALDTSDDVFPEKIRVTLVCDAPMPRAVNTKLAQEMGDNDIGWIEVVNTRGFPDGGDLNSHICIDGEWMAFKNRRADAFEITSRGARGTKAKSHKPGALIRSGRTFRKVIYLPGWREDFTTDSAWRSKKEAQHEQPRKVSQ